MKVIIAIIFSFSIASVVRAEDKDTNKSYSKTQKVVFEGSDIDGETRTPEGAFLNPKKGVKFLPLYKVTNQLDRDIKNSVEFVR